MISLWKAVIELGLLPDRRNWDQVMSFSVGIGSGFMKRVAL